MTNANGRNATRLPGLTKSIEAYWAIYDALPSNEKAFYQQLLFGNNIWPGDTRPLSQNCRNRIRVDEARSTLKTYGPEHPQAQAAVQGKRKVELDLSDLL